MSPAAFRKAVWAHYRTHGRHTLPWRKTRDPYRILVSEVMLQQTQVERVLPFYRDFLKRFPTARKLARAPLRDVLRLWQGLGYNRRAKQLRDAAQEMTYLPFFSYRRKKVDTEIVKNLEKLPGVGKYTARAVAVFAYNVPEILIETNIRTAVIHRFFPKRNPAIYGGISDKEVEAVLAKVLPAKNVREWYWALMDYGSYLKRSGVRLNARSAHYVKQKPFAGSTREARGAILRELSKGARTEARLAGLLGDDRKEQLRLALKILEREGLIRKGSKGFSLPR